MLMGKKAICYLMCLIIIMLLSSLSVVYADEESNFNIMYSNNNYTYIASYESAITDLGNGSVLVYAETYADILVDTMKLKIHLEKWNGDRWVVDSTWTNSKYESDNFYKYLTAEVKSGQRYRVRTIHIVNNNGEIESAESITSYITAR